MARSLDVVLVVDLESTCWDGPPPPGQTSEIIEIGLCTVDLKALTRTEKRSLLVKPVRSNVSEFCTKLTTITPDMHFQCRQPGRCGQGSQERVFV